MLLSSTDLFVQNQLFCKYHQIVNSLDPAQDRRFVGPDLGPNCLHSLSADETEGKEIACDGVCFISYIYMKRRMRHRT